MNSNIHIPADIQIFDYINPNESPEDDPDPLVENLDPSFDRDNSSSSTNS